MWAFSHTVALPACLCPRWQPGRGAAWPRLPCTASGLHQGSAFPFLNLVVLQTGQAFGALTGARSGWVCDQTCYK